MILITLDLIHNLALLVALSIVSGFIGQHWGRRRWAPWMQGLVFGGAAVIGMLRPMVLGPGLIFDGRSVMISLCSLFFGPVSAVVAAGMAVTCRIFQGGDGARMGVLVILASALLGLAFHHRLIRRGRDISAVQFLGFGLLVHIVMLLLTFTLPGGAALGVLKQIGLPVLLTYPLATVLAGKVLSDQQSRTRFMEALQESKEELRTTLYSIGDAVITTDRQGRVRQMNPIAEQLTGWPEADGRGKPLEEVFRIIGEETREIVENPAHRVLREGCIIGLANHTLLIARDGAERPIADSGAPIRDAACDITGVVLVFRDQTEERRAEAALRESKARLLRAQAVAQVGNWELDLVTRTIWASDEALRIYGLERTSPDPPFAVVQQVPIAEDRPRLAAALRALLEQGTPYDLEFQIHRANDDALRVIHTVATLVRDAQGAPTKVEGVIQDVTERRQAEQEKASIEARLHQSQKLESVGRLAGGIAHDLNNLLSPMLGYSQMLQDQLGPDDERRESAGHIVRAAERARDLVRQLLAFSRKQVLDFRALDLNQVVMDLQNLVRRTIREDIVIDFLPDPSKPVVRGDAGQLEQVILNLAINAQDAMPDGGRLDIRTAIAEGLDTEDVANKAAMPGRHVVLSVTDTGHGIDAQTQERLFEPFFTTKPPGHGTGLGLATSYGIVKQHGGSIHVSSEPSRGSTFSICLPVIEAAASPAEPARPCHSETPGGTETILLVEDDEMVRAVVKLMAEHHGYTVLSASDGQQAMAILETNSTPVHLLLTDVIMPEMNGRELFAMVSAKYPQLKVLFMSGHTADIMDTGGSMDETIQFIQKPFSTQGLAAKLRMVLDNG